MLEVHIPQVTRRMWPAVVMGSRKSGKTTEAVSHLCSHSFSTIMNLCTSAICLFGSVESPERFPPRYARAAWSQSWRHSASKRREKMTEQNYSWVWWDDPHLYMGRCLQIPLPVNVNDMTAWASHICADSKRRERQWWRIMWQGNEWSMN